MIPADPVTPERVVAALTAAGLTVATAESLTGGLLAATLTEVPGASAVLRGGLVVYATDLKHRLAGVDAALLADRGPVDPDVAIALADGARIRCGADIGVGLTGVAGPAEQHGLPPGTWYVALRSSTETTVRRGIPDPAWTGGPDLPARSRQQVRADAVLAALELLIDITRDTRTGEGTPATRSTLDE